MPNRILRDWTDSEKIDLISAEAERLFTRIFMKADDFGSFHANPKLVNSALFPLKNFSEKKIMEWIAELVKAKLIFLYQVDGKKYLRIIKFEQRLRNMRNSFPKPSNSENQEIMETRSELPQIAANCENEPPETETKRNETKQNQKQKRRYPQLIDFLNYCKEIFPDKYSGLEFSLRTKYAAWVENDWKDGNDKPIKNWKSKILNTIPHLKEVKHNVIVEKFSQEETAL